MHIIDCIYYICIIDFVGFLLLPVVNKYSLTAKEFPSQILRLTAPPCLNCTILNLLNISAVTYIPILQFSSHHEI